MCLIYILLFFFINMPSNSRKIRSPPAKNEEKIGKPAFLPTNGQTFLKINCQYCRDYLCIATQTDCGHIFCEGCLEDYLLYLDQCPVCERFQRERPTYGNLFLDNIINDYLRLINKQEHQRFQQRLKQRKLFKSGSSINIFHRGLRLDVRDKQYIWRKATITEYSNKRHENVSVFINYDNSQEFQFIRLRDKRLAVYGTFTNRKELPHYEEGKIVIERHGIRFELTQWNQLRRNEMESQKLEM